MKKLLIIDANSLINRAYYGVKYLSSKNGTPTNAVYGFMMTLMKLLEDNAPDYVCAAFDLKAPTFRHKIYAEYKAQRQPTPDGLLAQFPYVKKILSAMGVKILELEGYEADDMIGTVSRICEEADVQCLIATGDKDDLQLASDKTHVLLTITKQGLTETESCDASAVQARYGVTPKEFIDIKALMGDKSDNIPGVHGIGEKTAMTLIAKAKSIENLYADLSAWGITASNLKKLEEGRASAFLSKTLATIDRNVPIEFEFEACVPEDYKSSAELYGILKELELKKVIARMGISPAETKTEAEFLQNTVTENIVTADEFRVLADKIRKNGSTACTFGIDGGKIANAFFAIGNYAARVIVNKEISAEMETLLRDTSIKKYCVNIKDALTVTEIDGIAYDAAIAAYLLNPARTEYDITSLAADYLGVALNEKKQVSLFDEDGGEEFDKVFAIMPLAEVTGAELKKNGQEQLFYEVELPLVTVLADMQKEGILIDKVRLAEFSAELSARIDESAAEIYALAGEEFNINSPKQLGVILFEKLGLKPLKKTKSGYSTNADVLEKLAEEHPIVGRILEYRQLAKLKSTYCDGLLAVVNPQTGRIHSVFNQTVTVTGRISSAEPNLQNIPTRTELGSRMRRVFIAKDGCVLADADYSQIELRVLAHIAGDETMINAFKNGEDIHRITASQVLGIPPEEVTPEQRSSAKAVNFGIVYGIGEYSLSRDLNIPVKQAKEYIESYLKKYGGVKKYMEEIKEFAREHGYVKTLMNRIRYVPEISSSNFNVRAFGERVALNTPIQGTAADIIKLAMVRIYRRLKDGGYKSKLILQVHDELIIETYTEEKAEVEKILREEMEGAASLSVPLAADMSEGKSWYEAK